MRQLIVVSLVLLSVQTLHAGTIVVTTPTPDCECGSKTQIVEKKKQLTIEDLQSDLDKCNDKVDGYIKERESLLAEISKWKNIAQEATGKATRLTEENANLKRDNEKQSETIKTLQNANLELTKRCSDYSNKVDLCESQLGLCQKNLATCNARSFDLETNYKASVEAYKTLSNKCEKDAKDAADKLKKATDENNDLRCKLDESQQKLAKLQDDYDCLSNRYDELQVKYDNLLDENHRTQAHNAYLENVIKKDQIDDDVLQCQINELRKLYESAVRDLNECLICKKVQEGQIECLQNDNKELEKKLEDKTKEFEERLKAKDKECKAALEIERQKTLEEICLRTKAEEINEELKKQLRQKQQELDNCIKERNEYKSEIERLRKKISDLECENDSLKKEIEDLKCRINDLINELKLCQENSKKYQDDLKKCREELARAQKKIEELECEISELKNDLEKCKKDLCTVSEKLEGAKDATEIISAGVNQASTGVKTLTEVIVDLLSSTKKDCGCSN
ncbi:hypothetical protein Bhyg_14681 [Pseudolycoriella hygida]|uniref:Uncharacterized protein n=1 Tax=Pseudolycoriella hygida TaxID=35572 RepID=A0A9Q0MSD2_9DIPT|nr:hypothetical protein Bhyg_14681 [Pseudolycoriella hygida]